MFVPGTAVTKSDQPPPPIVPDRPPVALLMSTVHITQIQAIAAMAMQAGGDMLPRNIKTVGQAVAVMAAGYELGLRPWTALRHVYIVNGKTEIETRAMVGIVRARDPRIRFEWPEYTAEAVTCILHRGQEHTKVRYAIADANASGQTRKKKIWVGEGGQRKQIEVNGPWQLYPRDMLYAAATKRACRLGAPDLINAIEGVAAPYDVMDAEYTVRDVTDEAAAAPPARPPQSVDPSYNAGDEPGSPLSPEIEEAEWSAIGEAADAAPPAAAQAEGDALKEAKRLWGEVQHYAPVNVANVKKDVEVAGKVTPAGNIAWSKFTDDELTAAIKKMRAFIATGPDGQARPPRQTTLGDGSARSFDDSGGTDA